MQLQYGTIIPSVSCITHLFQNICSTNYQYCCQELNHNCIKTNDYLFKQTDNENENQSIIDY